MTTIILNLLLGSADWAHKLLCYDAAAVKEGIDALDKVPIQAKVLDTRKPDISLDNIYLQIVKWYTAHKNSFYYAFLAALGMVNHSPWGPPDLLVNPRVFYIIAESSPNLTAETKGRFAFRVTHAQVLTMQELQCSSSTAPVRTYDEDHQLIVARFQEYERLQPCSNPKNKKVLIILRFHFQNSTGEMFTFAPVYYEREFLADLESVAWLVPNWRERLIYGVVTGADGVGRLLPGLLKQTLLPIL
ncbi:hypothetical protein H0H93_012699 [Arthromyces matolae]|nr:hypothetical protein H0H93_012699 [Arthromyces matolae]